MHPYYPRSSNNYGGHNNYLPRRNHTNACGNINPMANNNMARMSNYAQDMAFFDRTDNNENMQIGQNNRTLSQKYPAEVNRRRENFHYPSQPLNYQSQPSNFQPQSFHAHPLNYLSPPADYQAQHSIFLSQQLNYQWQPSNFQAQRLNYQSQQLNYRSQPSQPQPLNYPSQPYNYQVDQLHNPSELAFNCIRSQPFYYQSEPAFDYQVGQSFSYQAEPLTPRMSLGDFGGAPPYFHDSNSMYCDFLLDREGFKKAEMRECGEVKKERALLEQLRRLKQAAKTDEDKKNVNRLMDNCRQRIRSKNMSDEAKKAYNKRRVVKIKEKKQRKTWEEELKELEVLKSPNTIKRERKRLEDYRKEHRQEKQANYSSRRYQIMTEEQSETKYECAQINKQKIAELERIAESTGSPARVTVYMEKKKVYKSPAYEPNNSNSDKKQVEEEIIQSIPLLESSTVGSPRNSG